MEGLGGDGVGVGKNSGCRKPASLLAVMRNASACFKVG